MAEACERKIREDLELVCSNSLLLDYPESNYDHSKVHTWFCNLIMDTNLVTPNSIGYACRAISFDIVWRNANCIHSDTPNKLIVSQFISIDDHTDYLNCLISGCNTIVRLMFIQTLKNKDNSLDCWDIVCLFGSFNRAVLQRSVTLKDGLNLLPVGIREIVTYKN